MTTPSKENYTSSSPSIEKLLNELQLFGDERKEVQEKTLNILNWEEGQGFPTSLDDILQGMLSIESLPRFGMTENMVYRDYVGIHQQRIRHLHTQSQYMIDLCFPEKYDFRYASSYAFSHDIIEGVSPFGDIITPIKDALSQDSWDIIDVVERRLSVLLMEKFSSNFFATLPPGFLARIFEDIFEKKTIESQVVSYLDKLDGLLTCFHELVTGNRNFIGNFNNYIGIFQDISDGKKMPELQKLFQTKRKEYLGFLEEVHGESPEDMNQFSDSYDLFDIKAILKQGERIQEFFGKCPNEESMREKIEDDFGFPAYGKWKKTTRAFVSFIDEAGKTLANGTEFLVKPRN